MQVLFFLLISLCALTLLHVTYVACFYKADEGRVIPFSTRGLTEWNGAKLHQQMLAFVANIWSRRDIANLLRYI